MKKTMKAVGGFIVVAAALVGAHSQAAEGKGSKSLDAIKTSIQAGLDSARPGINVSAVAATPISGIYQVSFEGAKDIYATKDGKHFFTGDLFAARPGELVNITEMSRNGDRQKAIASVSAKDMITFSPKGEVKQKVYVFTDIDCGYCQLLHSKMDEYNAMGIEISYLGYPRAGLNSNSFNKLASAWCADNPQDAITKLKNREEIPENICKDNPIANQFNVGRDIGLTGTPALVLETGELISGYLPPDRMKQRLNL